MSTSSSSPFLSGSGNGYELQMGRWSRRLAPHFIRFAGLPGATRVLDVGCGTGSLSFSLANDPEIHGVHGIDLSPDYIAYAKQKNEDNRLTFQLATPAYYRFPTRRSITHSRCWCCSLYPATTCPSAKCAVLRDPAESSPPPLGIRAAGLSHNASFSIPRLCSTQAPTIFEHEPAHAR